MSGPMHRQECVALDILQSALTIRLTVAESAAGGSQRKGTTMQTTLPLALDAADLKQLPRTMFGKIVLTVAASAFVALSAHIAVPLYFTPVPLTLQTFAVILVGLALGPVLGASAMMLYLLEGAAGLPVFSPAAGPGGIVQLLGPTAGFLFSYPLAATAAGAVVRAFKSDRLQFPAAILGGIAASVFIFGMGAGWVAHFRHASAGAVWMLAVVPFLPGEVVKVSAAAGIFSALRRWHRS
jgi:biotin transport system substrate-specific component